MNAQELIAKAEAVKTGEYGYTDGWIDQAVAILRTQERDYSFMKDLAIAVETKMNEALEQNKMLKEFVKPILAHDEDAIGDWDGFDLEELALKSGLYYKVLKNEPCNTGKEETHRCLCREYDCDFPTDCNHVVKFLLGGQP